MPIYKKSQVEQAVVIRVPVATTLTIAVYGSGDNYATSETEFGDDEIIQVVGALIAGDGANLSGRNLNVYVNGAFAGITPLSFDFATGQNIYSFTLGQLVAGTYTIRVEFPRTRIR